MITFNKVDKEISKLEKKISILVEKRDMLKNKNWMEKLPVMVKKVLVEEGLTDKDRVIELINSEKIYPYCFKGFGRGTFFWLCCELDIKISKFYPTIPLHKRPWKLSI